MEGRVEFCRNGDWGTVCDNFWDDDDASVVCRQLGLSSEGARAFGQAFFGEGTGPILLDQIRCFGVESRLADCSNVIGTNSASCRHSYDAGARCSSGML